MKNFESTTEFPKSLILAQQLEEAEDPNFIKEHLGELLDLISEETGKNLFEDVSTIYEKMKKTQCLVRVEQLSRILATIELGRPLEIGHEEETHYANAVIPEEEGIKLALAEGQAPGPFRAIVSFGKTLVGFKTDHLEVTEIDHSENGNNFRDEELRKRICRHVKGKIEKRDIRYMVIRIPKHLLDEKHLTEEELKEKDLPFVFRATSF